MPLTVQIKNLHSTWKKDYDKMAMLAQENGWGKDHYHKFKPDTARLRPCSQELHGRRRLEAGRGDEGLQAQPQRDLGQAQRRDQPGARTRPNGSVYNAIKSGVERAYTDAESHVNELQRGARQGAAIRRSCSSASRDTTLFKAADANVRKCHPNNMKDMFDYGLAAQEQLKEALPLLKKAKGFIPKKA